MRVRDPDDVDPPTVVITDPADGAQLSDAVPIIGTVTDARFFRYSVSVSSDGENFAPLSEGFEPVVDGELAILDLDLIVAGALVVRVQAEDWNGLETVVEAQYTVGPARFKELLLGLSGARPRPDILWGNIWRALKWQRSSMRP